MESIRLRELRRDRERLLSGAGGLGAVEVTNAESTPHGPLPVRGGEGALRRSKQLFDAGLAEGVGHSPGGVLAFAGLANLRADHGRAVFPRELVGFVFGGHAVGDADEAAAVVIGDRAGEPHDGLQPAGFVEASGIRRGVRPRCVLVLMRRTMPDFLWFDLREGMSWNWPCVCRIYVGSGVGLMPSFALQSPCSFCVVDLFKVGDAGFPRGHYSTEMVNLSREKQRAAEDDSCQCYRDVQAACLSCAAQGPNT